MTVQTSVLSLFVLFRFFPQREGKGADIYKANRVLGTLLGSLYM